MILFVDNCGAGVCFFYFPLPIEGNFWRRIERDEGKNFFFENWRREGGKKRRRPRENFIWKWMMMRKTLNCRGVSRKEMGFACGDAEEGCL